MSVFNWLASIASIRLLILVFLHNSSQLRKTEKRDRDREKNRDKKGDRKLSYLYLCLCLL